MIGLDEEIYTQQQQQQQHRRQPIESRRLCWPGQLLLPLPSGTLFALQPRLMFAAAAAAAASLTMHSLPRCAVCCCRYLSHHHHHHHSKSPRAVQCSAQSMIIRHQCVKLVKRARWSRGLATATAHCGTLSLWRQTALGAPVRLIIPALLPLARPYNLPAIGKFFRRRRCRRRSLSDDTLFGVSFS